jgi:hypothetical protein
MVPKILVRSIGIVHELRRGVLVERSRGRSSVENTGLNKGTVPGAISFNKHRRRNRDRAPRFFALIA